MPFREKMKRAFGTRPSDEGSELSYTPTSSSSSKRSRKEKKTRRNSSSKVYGPGESMPKPKYPLAYNKAHQDKLLAYNFGDAWKKRKSVQSQYISPMGSRWPSARTSMAISRQQSYSASTTEQAADDEPTTITMNGDHSYLQVGNGVALSRQSTHAVEYHEKQQLEDNREQAHLSSIADSQLDALQPLPPLTTEIYLNGVELGEPLFTEEELRLAMTRTTIGPLVEGR